MIFDNQTTRITISYFIISSRLAGPMEDEGVYSLTELKGISIIFCVAINCVALAIG